ncbi:MAG: hypothetical protein A3J83_03800 [Elusimicrobia bacterium RIFOXYA2_FULL_40_6]|nr:MAG: hypothetical protein A3J83_03800 [Elusimicrobia bacterium RIFOXYA2_FULL_40_6]
MTLKPNEEIIWRKTDEEIVLLNKTSGWYYSLDKIGSEIWLMLNQNKSLEKIAASIAKKYGITQQKALKDTNDLIKNLKKEKILSEK